MNLLILGVCGTFMANVAILAKAMGHTVVGLDANCYPPMSTVLAEHGIAIQQPISVAGLPEAVDCVIVGNVMQATHPVITAVEERGWPMQSGPEWLHEHVLKGRHVIAVSGTHGKTTTSSIIAYLLSDGGFDPGYLIGGVCTSLPCSAALGAAPYFVIEADEYDTAFFDKRAKLVHYPASTWVLNNCEFDHADIYDDITDIEAVFSGKLSTLDRHCQLIVNADDERMTRLATQADCAQQSFSLRQGDWHADCLQPDGTHFAVSFKGQLLGEVRWSMLGQHNVSNALAGIAVATQAGMSFANIAAALASFQGVARRCQRVAELNDIVIYDDFAHHPTAIAATLQGLSASQIRDVEKPQRIIAVVLFGSHSMRLGVHAAVDFQSALKVAHHSILYTAGEAPDHMHTLMHLLGDTADLVETDTQLLQALKSIVQPGDQVCFMGNRSMRESQHQLIEALTAVHT